ncbi:GNAT family N-acetyltransferase [Marseilla massiliensis]|uniref:GNAT family N-acetyltransferase n=1 Tax=Marseilla massiliensis TaxID=1841864 RepID=UPI00201384F8|nr:GNAT family N-acetyltransferase [Marseilla massiliensis]MCL1611666.1 GNAT family N-acetyltransferase [Marseilla massiliensis]
MIDIRHYEPQSASEWNAFVAESKNGTFLFDRRYMDYHSDRFADSSLMVYRDGRLFALLPANREGDVLCSHRGLTYGGLVTGPSATASAVVEAFEAVNAYLRGEGLRRVVYKAVPWIYHRVPSEEDLYALFRVCRARLVARDISSAIMQPHRLKWHRDRRYGINRCRNNGVAVELSDDFEGFWPVLEDNLMRSHGARPVHSLGEIRLLKSRFPDNILLYVARRDGRVLGGTVLYVTPQVVHAQYISASAEGKALRVIDAIYDRILNGDFADCLYFDFGKSTEDCGRVLNESLIYQKEGFGGRGVCYDWYEWSL